MTTSLLEEKAQDLKLEKLRPSVIRRDGGTQVRALLDPAVIDDYKEQMEAGAVFPALVVFEDETGYWLADGFYRCAAFEQAEGLGWGILCEIHQGTQRDAVLYSLGANAAHGQPRTNEDKRRAVMTLLADREWEAWSDTVIAEKAQVSQPFVSKLRRAESQNVLSEGEQQSTVRRGKDDVVRDTSNIGRKSDEEQERIAREEAERNPELPGVPPATTTTGDFQEDSEEDLARQRERSGVRNASGDWSSDDVVAAIGKHGGSMFRGQLEELGCTYAAILGALQADAIAQPEVGKYTLRTNGDAAPTGESAREPAAEGARRASTATAESKPRPSVEDLLKGRKLAVSFVFGLPGVKGKFNVSVYAGDDPHKAARKLIDSDKAPRFPEEIQDMIVSQLKGNGASPSKSSAKAVAKRSARNPTKKAAAKKKPVRSTKTGSKSKKKR